MTSEHRRLETGLSLALALALAAASLYFFSNAMNLITQEEPRVAASIMATVIGIILLSASITLLRTWTLARALNESKREGQS